MPIPLLIVLIIMAVSLWVAAGVLTDFLLEGSILPIRTTHYRNKQELIRLAICISLGIPGLFVAVVISIVDHALSCH